MRFTEIADPKDQLALWRLISDNVWSAVAAQARELARQKAQAAARPKPKKIKPKKVQPRPAQAPKPKPIPPQQTMPKSSVPLQPKAVTPSRPPALPSSQPVLRPTHSSSSSQADLHGLQQGKQSAPQSFTPQIPF